MKHEYILGGVGTTLGVVGTATQVNEVLQTISLIITIIGAAISFIVVPILTWYKNAKKDGQITREELEEGAAIVKEGVEKTHEAIQGSQTEGEDQREEIKHKKKGGLE